MTPRGRLLVLWNQTEEDVYERWRAEGPRELPWSPGRVVPDVGTVREEMDAFIKALTEAEYDVHLVNVEDDLERVIGAIRLYRPDAVFNLVEYFSDDAIQETYIAGLYEMLGVSYTGNRPVTLATCQNKYRTKLILEAADLPTSPFVLIEREPIPILDPDEIPFPVIVKPALEDASGGIEAASVCHTQEQMESRIRYVFKEFEMPSLVESYIEGREIHAAVIGNKPPQVLPLFEMEFDDSEFNPEDEWRPQIISFRAKWDPHSKDFYSMDAVCPARELEPETEDEIRQVALGAFKALGCRDYARVDMRVDEDGDIYILEVNPNPDLVDETAYVMCATASGRTYSQTLAEIASFAVARSKPNDRPDDPSKAGLPSDQLLKEWHLAKRERPAQVVASESVVPTGGDDLGDDAMGDDSKGHVRSQPERLPESGSSSTSTYPDEPTEPDWQGPFGRPPDIPSPTLSTADSQVASAPNEPPSRSTSGSEVEVSGGGPTDGNED